MARPIDHDTGSSLATGAWETAKGAAAGAGTALLMGGLLGGGLALGAVALIGGVAAIGTGIGIAAIVGGAIAGLAGTGLFAGPVVGVAAALGGFLGLGRGASKVSEEKAAYQSKVMAHERQVTNDRAMLQNQGLQAGYQMGFQEGQAYAVNRIQQELQQQAMMEQQQQTLMGQAPVEGHHAQKVLAARGGHQHQHASKAEMVAHQREQAAGATQEIGG